MIRQSGLVAVQFKISDFGFEMQEGFCMIDVCQLR